MSGGLILAALSTASAILALLPACFSLVNLRLFRPPPERIEMRRAVSVIVPARNEEAEIGACLAALQASRAVELEIIVVDDHSEDRTALIVRTAAAADPRIRLHPAPALPPGWSGKQHACFAGAGAARHDTLLFIDCDVRLAPDAVARMAEFLARSGAALVSGFPCEKTLSLGEILMIPLIHVVLLGYLPIASLRRSVDPAYGAGCGQLMLAEAQAYHRMGGHAAIRHSWHDGVQLPRAFRRHGLPTDIFDATSLADCRMYRGFAQTWRGLSKNAREGMATPVALPVWTLLLGGGQVLPFLLLPLAAWLAPGSAATELLGFATALLLLSRTAIAWRFRQDWRAVPLLPVGILLLLLLQWRALLGRSGGKAASWRGRTQFSG